MTLGVPRVRIRYLLAWSLTGLMIACGGGSAQRAASVTPPAFWLPYAGYTQSGTTLNLNVGVIPSTLSNTTLQPVAIGQFKRTIALVPKFATSSATPSTPFAVVYLASGSDGNYHLYTLELADTSALPVPRQISSLSMPASFASCLKGVYDLPLGGSDPPDPTATAYVLMGASVATAPDGSTVCADTPLRVVHYTDSAATTPSALPATVTTFPLATLCSATGTLSGLLASDASHNVTLYRTVDDWQKSANAVPLIAGVNVNVGNAGVSVGYDRAGHLRPEGCTLFLAVQDVATGNLLLYRIDASGRASKVYETTGQLDFGLSAQDDTNVYFMDVATVGSLSSYTLVKQPIDGSPSTALYTTSPTPSTQWYTPIDTDGANVLLYFVDSSTTPSSVSLLSAPTNSPSVPTLLVGSVASAFLDFASDHLFVTQQAGGGFSSSVYVPSDPAPVQSESNSAFVPRFGGWDSTQRVIQLRNLPADGTWGGASVVTLTTDTLTAAPMTQNGTAYVTPTGTTNLNLTAFGSIAFGNIQTGSSFSGLAVDFSRNEVVTISVPGEQVIPFYSGIN